MRSTRVVRWLALALLFAVQAGGPVARAHQAPAVLPQTGLILGRVIDADTNTPLSGILITLRDMSGEFPGAGRPSPPRATLTDTLGRFVFRGLARGSYQIAATIGGSGFSPSGFIVSGSGHQIGAYLNGGFGQRRPTGPLQAIDLADGQRSGDAVIRLWKGGAIDGTVLDEAGEPLVGVSVASVRRNSDGRLGTGPSTKTDDRGQYHLSTLPPGEYLVVVPQTQVLMPLETIDAVLALQQPPGVAANQFFANAAPSPTATGIKVGSAIIQPPGPTAYVMNGFAPVQQGGKMFAYQTTFYPSATAANRATPIVIRSGEELSNMNVRLQPVPGAEVSGILMDDGGVVPNFGVRLMPAEVGDGASVLDVAQVATNSRGEFHLPLVPAGQYTLIAIKPNTGAIPNPAAAGAPVPAEPPTISGRPGAWAEQSVSVGTDPVRGLVLTMRAGGQLSGRVEFRGASERPPADRLSKMVVSVVAAQPLFRTTSAAPLGLLDASGEFTVRGIPPGRSVVRIADLGPAWMLQSVTMGGQDITDAAMPIAGESSLSNVLVVFTDQPAEVSGTVRGATAGAEANATVFMFPANRARWPDARVSTKVFRSVRLSRAGGFRLSGVIPGEYLIVAVIDERSGDWPDQKFLTKIAALATTIRVGAGQKATASLTTVDVR